MTISNQDYLDILLVLSILSILSCRVCFSVVTTQPLGCSEINLILSYLILSYLILSYLTIHLYVTHLTPFCHHWSETKNPWQTHNRKHFGVNYVTAFVMTWHCKSEVAVWAGDILLFRQCTVFATLSHFKRNTIQYFQRHYEDCVQSFTFIAISGYLTGRSVWICRCYNSTTYNLWCCVS